MSPLLPPSRMRWCSAWSRSFLLGPDGCQRPGFMATDNGPAGAPPGQGLRSSGLIGQGRTGTKKRSAQIKVSTVRGERRHAYPQQATCPGLEGHRSVAVAGVPYGSLWRRRGQSVHGRAEVSADR